MGRSGSIVVPVRNATFFHPEERVAVTMTAFFGDGRNPLGAEGGGVDRGQHTPDHSVQGGDSPIGLSHGNAGFPGCRAATILIHRLSPRRAPREFVLCRKVETNKDD